MINYNIELPLLLSLLCFTSLLTAQERAEVHIPKVSFEKSIALDFRDFHHNPVEVELSPNDKFLLVKEDRSVPERHFLGKVVRIQVENPDKATQEFPKATLGPMGTVLSWVEKENKEISIQIIRQNGTPSLNVGKFPPPFENIGISYSPVTDSLFLSTGRTPNSQPDLLSRIYKISVGSKDTKLKAKGKVLIEKNTLTKSQLHSLTQYIGSKSTLLQRDFQNSKYVLKLTQENGKQKIIEGFIRAIAPWENRLISGNSNAIHVIESSTMAQISNIPRKAIFGTRFSPLRTDSLFLLTSAIKGERVLHQPYQSELNYFDTLSGELTTLKLPKDKLWGTRLALGNNRLAIWPGTNKDNGRAPDQVDIYRIEWPSIRNNTVAQIQKDLEKHFEQRWKQLVQSDTAGALKVAKQFRIALNDRLLDKLSHQILMDDKAKELTKEQIDKLIQDLDSNDFSTRQSAEEKLSNTPEAHPKILALIQNKSATLEQAIRAKRVDLALKNIEQQFDTLIPTAKHLRVHRVLFEVLAFSSHNKIEDTFEKISANTKDPLIRKYTPIARALHKRYRMIERASHPDRQSK